MSVFEGLNTIRRPTAQTVLFIGLTMALVGYFAVWLPGPTAGLRLIGLELGEWIKFLGVGSRRDIFYLPPIAIGLVIALLTAGWPNTRAQTWVARLLAVLVSLLALPAVAVVMLEPRSEWAMRLALIALVAGAVLWSSFAAARGGHERSYRFMIGATALLAVILPIRQYVAVLPVVESILQRPVGIGAGLWLNTVGFLLVLAAAVLELWSLFHRGQRKQKDGHVST